MARVPISCASPACRISTACSPPRNSAPWRACPSLSTSRARAEVSRCTRCPRARARARTLPAGIAHGGDARVGAYDQAHGRCRAAGRRRTRAPRRDLRPRDQHRGPHRAAAQLQGALPCAVQGGLQRAGAQRRAGGGLGARPGAPGKPLHRRRQVLGRRARPDAADARDRALGRQAHRPARLQPGATSSRCR